MALTDDSVFDEGLQLERTALAWQRTLLSLVVASLAVGRGLEALLGPAAWLVAVAGAAASAIAFGVARKRYVAAHNHLTRIDPESLPGSAGLVAAAALLCLIAGIAAFVFVLEQSI